MIALTRFAHHKKIVLVTIAALLVIACLLFIPGPAKSGATIVITPNNFLNQAGQTWTAQVFVSSNQPVNSVDTTINFNTDLAQVVQTDIADSDFEMKVFEPSHDARQGTVRFVQTSLQSYDDRQALVGTITFKGTKQGQMDMTAGQTKIVADDGQGTNIYQPQLSQSIGQWLLGLIGLNL